MSKPRPARELYPGLAREEKEHGRLIYGASDYMPILNELGKIIVKVDDGSYHGDSRILYLSGDGRYGYLQFGWGTCSGCDMLMGCRLLQEIDELIQHLSGSIKWFDSAEECLRWFREHDWEGDYSWHDKETHSKTRQFIAEVVDYLQAAQSDVD